MNFDLLTVSGDIDNRLMQQVLRIDRNTKSNRLILLLRTRGGDPFVAYRTMQHLGALYGKIEIVVADKAMSAGTLMCMGADKIYMFEGSSLGPLDLQVPHPTDGGQISTLDIRQSTYNIFSLTQTVALQLYEQAVGDMSLGKTQAAKVSHDAAVELLKPMIEKIDPYHLHASYRAASIGQKYAYLLLVSRMMKNDPDTAEKTAEILTENYQMHSYSITMEEAKDYLSLVIDNVIDLDVLDTVKPFIHAIPDGVNFIPVRNMPPSKSKAVKEEKNDTKEE